MLIQKVVRRSSGHDADPLTIATILMEEAPTGEHSFNRILNVGRGRLRVCWESLVNESVANRVARWALRACGPDFKLKEVYPLYCSLVRARGVRPWKQQQFVRWAFGYGQSRWERRLKTAKEKSVA